ncbi:hypothetical protein [Clostridium rectalis]|uniref:hypothetical protein n=1 Tax=Clostridium rectalis TaxID=2040295 RepID=UPI0013DE3852|nr:hypothetical protein [Clostridium rectalis]
MFLVYPDYYFVPVFTTDEAVQEVTLVECDDLQRQFEYEDVFKKIDKEYIEEMTNL